MSIKKFMIKGKFRMGESMQPFEKFIMGDNEEHAKEFVYSDLGSKHKTPRNKIKIDNIEEVDS